LNSFGSFFIESGENKWLAFLQSVKKWSDRVSIIVEQMAAMFRQPERITEFCVGNDDGEVSKIILKGTKTVEIDDDSTDTSVTTSTTTEFDAVEISAAYVGDRKFSASVRTNLITDQRELLIYNGDVIFSRTTFSAGDDEASALVAAMKSNKNFNARLIESGKLNDITQSELTSGKNPTVTVSSYDKGTNVLERFKWNCIVADSDSPAIAKVLSSFVAQSYETGHLGFFCVAGKSSQDFDDKKIFLNKKILTRKLFCDKFHLLRKFVTLERKPNFNFILFALMCFVKL